MQSLIDERAGSDIDAGAALRDTRKDPMLAELVEILGERVGEKPDDYVALIEEGLRRFRDRVRTGYKDGGTKKDQVPERGTGDFLVWEETFRHVASSSAGSGPFVFVTADGKEDWRLITGGTDVGPRPELVAEALERTGRLAYLIKPPFFYDLLAAGGSEEDRRVAAELGASDSDWTQEAFDELIQELQSGGYEAQVDVIFAAAASDSGLLDREGVYEAANFDSSRTLTRFATPASRIAGYLREEEVLGTDAREPLWAVYDGPGKAVGYRVPASFSQFIAAWDESQIDSASDAENQPAADDSSPSSV